MEKSIEVHCPLQTVLNRWTQFEEFLEGVKRVTQLDNQRVHWEAEIAGKHKEWNALQRIAWESESGESIAGVVTFEPSPSGPGFTRVNLKLTCDPNGFVESVGDSLGVVTRKVEKDLENFKKFIENRRQETGAAWRGTIRQ